LALAVFLAAAGAGLTARGDEPYARSRDYDLRHSRIVLQFDLEQRKVIGDVTHKLAILKDGAAEIEFDSVGLDIESAAVNSRPAKFDTTRDKLRVKLPAAAHAGEQFEIEIRYTGKPKKGLYFIVPDKNNPDRPKQVWTQGESEDTRYYLPTYDYPNDRLTTEMVVTVPAGWITVSNGKLVGVSDAGKGLKTWHWEETLPSSTYLITLVAGEFDEVKDTWRGKAVDYYAPRGRGDRLSPNYHRTPAMMELFSKKLGVDYPWEKYSQAMVDDFVAGGMENSSATTNTSSSLTHPKLVPEYPLGQDELISHELAHQWFGDLVTCKDWGHIWLNEGFASFFEFVWTEARFGKEEADLARWQAARQWAAEEDLYGKPIVRHDFHDSSEFDGNAYGKGAWVLYMLRRQLGEGAFYRGLKHYLEVNRGKNVVTADLAKAIEEATSVNIDPFLAQWVYGAGAPQFDVHYTYDDGKKEMKLQVKQTQKAEGPVGIFHVPLDVAVTTATGSKDFRITVSKADEAFAFGVDGPPLMVLFDKGTQILKTVDFKKEPKEWIYQLKNASEPNDRLDAAVALGKIQKDSAVVAALNEAVLSDQFWAVRATAADSLAEVGGADAAKPLLTALEGAKEPWLRSRLANALGRVKDDPAVAERLEAVVRGDRSFRARAAALQALGRLKSPGAFAAMTGAVSEESPDDFVRNAALRAYGALGDDKAVPVVLQWSAPSKPVETRRAAIGSLGRLQKNNHDITHTMMGYLKEESFPIRLTTVFALGERGDQEAIPALEALLKTDDLSIAFAPYIESQIARLKAAGTPAAEKRPELGGKGLRSADAAADQSAVVERLDKVERLLQELVERVKAMEARLPPKN
ncbi:MAG TPA: M1 family aminopeptidase, partial [Methylomirabilota bacterium]|nr:M1 family aminopeptidase [Methylomirabilota bacterium]